MDKRTVASAHSRIDSIETRITRIEIELNGVQRSVNRIETILLSTAGAIITMLAAVLYQM